MRLTRRRALGVAAGALAAAGAGSLLAASRRRGSDAVSAVPISAKPVRAFSRDRPDETRFGELTFRSGIALSGDDSGFGGWSGLWRSEDGVRLIAVSDNAFWLNAAVAYDGGRLSGLSDAVIAPILGEDGVPLRHGPAYDTESLAIADGVAYVGIERVHEVRRFDLARSGSAARGTPIPVPPEVKGLKGNDSLEAVAVAPPGHPLAGAVIAIAEQAKPGDDAPTRGWILTGPVQGAFDVARADGFDITDLTFLPDGDALLLERRYTVLAGVFCRIRRIARDAFRPDAMVAGRLILDAGPTHEIDNMEGIATHLDVVTGKRVVTLISDDNYNPLQRTLLLEFLLEA